MITRNIPKSLPPHTRAWLIFHDPQNCLGAPPVHPDTFKREEGTMTRLVSHLINGAVVLGLLAGAAFAGAAPVTTDILAAPTTLVTRSTGFDCLRPVYELVFGVNGSPHPVRMFTGFIPCHESYESDHKTGLMIFPEA